MSTKKPVRYASAELRCTKCKKKDNDLQGVMIAHEKGRYVTYEDFEELDILCKKLMKDFSDISCENIKLRKAGDALANAFASSLASELGDGSETLKNEFLKDETRKELFNWHAAKEGKPSV